MKAYMKDVQENPDLTSGAMMQTAKEQKMNIPKILHQEIRKTQWHEAKTSDGKVYYWHSSTGGNYWQCRHGCVTCDDCHHKKKKIVI